MKEKNQTVKQEKGITLIALIISVVILLILAVVSMPAIVGEEGIINRTKQTRFLSDVGKYKEELELYKTNWQLEYQLNNEQQTDEITSTKQINTWEYNDIKKYISSFSKRYENKIGIKEGKLVYKDTGNETETKWAEQLGLQIQTEYATIKIEEQGLGTVEGINVTIENEEINAKVGQTIKLKANTCSIENGDQTIESSFKGWYDDNGILKSSEQEYEFKVMGNQTITAKFETNETLIYYLDENNEEKIKVDTSKTLTGYANDTTIKKIIVGTTCASIGEDTFSGCANLKEIVAETKEAISIGKNSFLNCLNLIKINFSNVEPMEKIWALSRFGNCTNLKEVTLGSMEHPVTYLQAYTFEYCTQKDLTIKIYVEEGVTNLIQEPWGATNATIEYYSATTGELVNVIWGANYSGNTQINWTELPNADKITIIRANAFDGCENLALTSLPQNLKSIDKEAFKDCKKIAINEIPSKCEYIGAGAFSGCESIINLNANTENTLCIYGVDKNTDNTFYCLNLTQINFTNIDLMASKGWNLNIFGNCTNLKEVTLGSIGHPVTYLQNGTFRYCTQKDLTIKIYVEEGVTNLIQEPWGATNATIEYYSATTGELIN